MKKFVIDASILLKLFFAEEHSDAAVQYVKGAQELQAPDLLWVEASYVVWRRVRRGEITAPDAASLMSEMVRVPIKTWATLDLVPAALALAVDTGRTLYDCLYLALAVREDVPLLTGDERFVTALGRGQWAKRVCFVGSQG